MSLASLKRPTPSATRSVKLCSLEDFISGAELYSRGHRETALLRQPTAVPAETHSSARPATFKRSTFTLSAEAKAKLTHLCQRSGIPRSRLLRIWLEALDVEETLPAMSTSETK